MIRRFLQKVGFKFNRAVKANSTNLPYSECETRELLEPTKSAQGASEPPLKEDCESTVNQTTPSYIDNGFELFVQIWHAAARNVADRGDHRMVGPNGFAPPRDPDRPMKIGLYGNVANQNFITARALRRIGYDVEIVLQVDVADRYPLSQPYWEEMDVEIQNGAINNTASPPGWTNPDYVRVVPFNQQDQEKYQHRYSAVAEVRELYERLTGHSLAPDVYLLLAQWMGYWDYIETMKDYDVVQLSMWPICLGAFCPRPYVVCPLGEDLYTLAFRQDVQGLLFRAGFRTASHIAVPEIDYPLYLDRLAITSPRTFMPLLIDTDVYCEGDDAETRAGWQKRVGGSRYLLSVCRQSWGWKGNDLLIRAFADFFQSGGDEWRLLLQSWGEDYERSRSLVGELGLDDVTAWLPLCSKPLLRRRQRAADVVCDHFVWEGYGTSVLESLAAAKPVLMKPLPDEAAHHFRAGLPPLVGARTQSEITTALRNLKDDAYRATIAMKSRQWVEEEHGYKINAKRYISILEKACSFHST